MQDPLYIADDILRKIERERKTKPGTDIPVYKEWIRLIINTSQLLHEIKMLAYIEGNSIDSDNLNIRHLIQDIAEADNAVRTLRVIDTSIREVVDVLMPYASPEMKSIYTPPVEGEQDEPTSYTDEIDLTSFPDEYTFELKMPDDFPMTSIHLLLSKIREYVIASVLYDWLRFIMPKSSEVWLERKQQAYKDIDSQLYARIRRTRRRQSPM